MLSRCIIGLLSLCPFWLMAQAAFVASWSFEGNRAGSSDNSNVVVTPLNLSGINELGFPTGATGKAVSLGGWSTTSAVGDYVYFSVTPQAYRITITSVSFAFNNSATGPTQLVVRSSADNFMANIGVAAVTTTFNTLSISLAYIDIEATTTFRIYGYSASSGSGALRLDNLTINGTVALVPLPVNLVYFKGQYLDKQVNIAWQTSSEHNSSHFDLQRSTDALEFITIHKTESAGSSYQTKNYTFLDTNPLLGTNYYRLRQVDNDGLMTYSKIISIILQGDEPQIWAFQNVIFGQEIKIRLQQIDPQSIKIYNEAGQFIDFDCLLISGQDYILTINNAVPAGFYFLAGYYGMKRSIQRILVTN
jgi:hypothetical protein